MLKQKSYLCCAIRFLLLRTEAAVYDSSTSWRIPSLDASLLIRNCFEMYYIKKEKGRGEMRCCTSEGQKDQLDRDYEKVIFVNARCIRYITVSKCLQ